LFVISIAGVLFLHRDWRRNFRDFVNRNYILALSLAITVFLFAAHFLAGPKLHKIYSLYFIPFFIIAAGLTAHLTVERLKKSGAWTEVKGFVISITAAVLITVPISISIHGFDVIFFNRFDYGDSDLQRIKRGGEYLASVTTEDDIILTDGYPYHVFAAGRYSFPERINQDSYVDSDDRSLLERFNRHNTDMFVEWLEEDASVFIFQKAALPQRMDSISGGTNLLSSVERILEEHYDLVGSASNVFPLKDKRGEGELVVHRRSVQ